MGGGGGYSVSSQTQSTSSVVDSYNETYQQTLNLSNVGNVAVNAPDPTGSVLGNKWLMVAAVGLAAVAGWFILKR